MAGWGIPLCDVAAMAVNLPPESATMRAVNPDHHWTLDAHLLARVVDNTTALVWMKTKDAQDHPNNWPEPIRRPGVDPDEGKEIKHYGADPVPLAELDEFLRPKCRHSTRSGRPCRNRIADGHAMCRRHLNLSEGSVTADVGD